MGILLPDGSSVFNVAIRTIQKQSTHAIYGVGGGITWDSTWESEYQETKQKSAVLYRKNPQFEVISTGKISQGQLTFLDQHLERLADSCRYFAYPFDQEAVQTEIDKICQDLDLQSNYRLRMAIAKDGQLQLEVQALQDLPASFCQAKLVLQEQNLQTPFAYFKTSHRPHLTLEKQEQIYYNPHGQLLETSIGNLVLQVDGKRYTPPADLGILNGIYRQQLLQTGQVTEKILTLEDLKTAEAVYACNAVRGMYELSVED